MVLLFFQQGCDAWMCGIAYLPFARIGETESFCAKQDCDYFIIIHGHVSTDTISGGVDLDLAQRNLWLKS